LLFVLAYRVHAVRRARRRVGAGRARRPGAHIVAAPTPIVTTCVALLRGINVGRAKRLGMVELREVVESLGHTNVRTLLNSGNVVFDAKRGSLPAIARSLEAAIQTRFGFAAPVIVVTAAEVDAIVRANPLTRAPDDPSRYLVAFLPSAAALVKARPLLAEAWAPEALAV